MEAVSHKKHQKLTASSLLLTVAKWLLLLFFAFYAIFPMLWLAMTSFKTNAELMANPFTLPEVWQVQNYINAIELSGIGRMMINSVVISFAAMLCNILVAAMIAYCISRFEFKFKEGIFAMFSAGILVPLNALMVPYFIIINKLGLYDKMLGLVLVYTAIGIPISTFIVRGFMNSLPREIEEAAYIDGC